MIEFCYKPHQRMPSVAVLVNANARRFVDDPSLLDAIARAASGRARVHVTRSKDDVLDAIRSAHADRADTIVVCGGDGAYSAVATEVLAAWKDAPLPTFAFAPGGTVGTIPRALRVQPRGSTIGGISRVIHAACTSERATLTTPTLRIEADGEPRVAFIFGTGLVASFFELYDPSAARAWVPSEGRGILSAAAIVARVFLGSFVGGALAERVLQPVPMELAIDGEILPWKGATLVVSSVLRDLGLGMKVTHRGGEDPERPHVVASALPPRRLGPRMPRVLAGRPIGDPGEPHVDALVRALSITFPGRGPYVVDGDLRHAHHLVVRAGPRFEILRPS